MKPENFISKLIVVCLFLAAHGVCCGEGISDYLKPGGYYHADYS